MFDILTGVQGCLFRRNLRSILSVLSQDEFITEFTLCVSKLKVQCLLQQQFFTITSILYPNLTRWHQVFHTPRPCCDNAIGNVTTYTGQVERASVRLCSLLWMIGLLVCCNPHRITPPLALFQYTQAIR